MRTDGSAYSVYVATEELMTNVEVVERLKKNNEAEHAAIDLYQATFFRTVSPLVLLERKQPAAAHAGCQLCSSLKTVIMFGLETQLSSCIRLPPSGY